MRESQDLRENLFLGLLPEDEWWVEELASLLRYILKEKSLTSRQIVLIGEILHYLERLPLITSGIDIMFTLKMGVKGDWNCINFHLSQLYILFDSTGCIDTSGLGSDTFSSIAFEAQSTGFRKEDCFYEWFNDFRSYLECVDIEIKIDKDNDESIIDWQKRPESITWNNLVDEGEKGAELQDFR